MKLLSALSVILCASAFAAAPVIPFFRKAPVVDGVISVGEYAEGVCHELKKIWGRGEPTNPTTVYFGRDETFIYVAYDCKDIDIANIRAQFKTPEERDNSVYTDDCIEFQFDPWNAPETKEAIRQFVVNSNGILYDALGTDRWKDWDVLIKVSKGAKGWQVEMAVPIVPVCGYVPTGAELWRLNLARNSVRIKEACTLTGGSPKGFNAPENFLTFRSDAQTVPVTILTKTQDQITFHAEKPCILTLTQIRADGKLLGQAQSLTLKAGEEGTLSVRQQKGVASFKAVTEGWQLSWLAEAIQEPSPIVKMTEKPLYRELWGNEYTMQAKEGTTICHHPMNLKWMTSAFQFGQEWSIFGEARRALQDGLIPEGLPSLLSAFGFPEAVPDFKAMISLTNYMNTVPKGTPRWNGMLFLLGGEECKKSYLDGIRENSSLVGYKKNIWGLWFGDEVSEHQEEGLLHYMQHPKEWPGIVALSERIQEKYGHPLPSSNGDADPLKWIAMRRYAQDELLDLSRRAYAIVKQEYPGVHFVSDDPMGTQSKIYDFAYFTPDVAEYVCFQLYPRNHHQISDFSALTKYMADLSSCAHFTPCPHVENYGADYKAEEVIEKLSQAVRVGADGFHLYLDDVTGKRNGRRYLCCDQFGAPERYQTILAVIDEMKRMPRLRFPEADCGLFVSINAIRATTHHVNTPDVDFALHSLLENTSGCWFKYFSEGSINLGQADLSKYKAVFVPYSKYLEEQALTALEEYARAGGVLVVMDPEAFLFTPVGESLLARRAALTGIVESKQGRTAAAAGIGDSSVSLLGAKTWDVTLADGVSVLGRFDDGRPALVQHRFGKGQVMTFAVDLLHYENVKHESMRSYFRKLTESLGLKHDCDIWRFRFPLSLVRRPQGHPGRCLTNNYVFWERCKPLLGANDKLAKATYRYSMEPDAPADNEAADGVHAFEQGRLTDRRAQVKLGNVGCPPEHFAHAIVGWKSGAPFEISIDLGEVRTVESVELFTHGVMRDVTLFVSLDGKQVESHAFPADHAKEDAMASIVRKCLPLPNPREARYLKLAFSATSQDGPILPEITRIQGIFCKGIEGGKFTEANFQISEIEIWGK